MKHSNRWMVLVLIIAGLLLSACTQTSGPAGNPEPAHIEHIEGTDLSRVELTEKAAERIDIQTVPVREEQVVRTRRFGGRVVDTDDSVTVRVALIESDLNKVDRSQPVIVRPLEPGADGWLAQVVAAPDPEEATKALYCRIDATQSGFALDERVYVEVSISGSGTQQKVIPYAAVLYDTHGETWAYTRLEPLTFVRHLIVVDYIEGDLAVLSEGPPAGTEVVTAGAGELFGAESGIGGGGH
jgi:hypothetical protein